MNPSDRWVRPRFAPPQGDLSSDMARALLAEAKRPRLETPPPSRGLPFHPAQRVRAAFLTPCLLMGGAERWMISLARACDRRRVEWVGTVVADGGALSPELSAEMAAYMPVYTGS